MTKYTLTIENNKGEAVKEVTLQKGNQIKELVEAIKKKGGKVTITGVEVILRTEKENWDDILKEK